MSAEFESGFFVKREAWHKQGVVLADYPDTQEAYEASGLNWAVEKRKLLMPTGVAGELADTEMYAVTRMTDNAIFGYVTDRYALWQNRQAFDWLQPLVDSGLWKIETAGSLKGGSICWALLKQGQIEIVPNDVLKEYLLVCSGHDGATPLIIQPTMIRVVCNNTLQYSLNHAGGKMKIMHTMSANVKMDFVQKLFTESENLFASQIDAFKRLLDVRVTMDRINAICDELYGVKAAQGGSKRAETLANKRMENAKMMVFYGASGQDELGIAGTGYGLYNALSEYNEHYLVGKNTDAGYNVLFGRGADLNRRLLSSMMAMV